MADSLWICEQDLIDNSVVIDSIDFKAITPNIIYVQDEYIQHLLGTDLFNEINGQIIANTVTAPNSTLLDDWIKKVLINYILAETAPDLVYRWTNKSIVTKNAENSTAVTAEQLEGIVDRYKNRAVSYGRRLTNYLIQEASSYPLFNSNSDISDVRPDYLQTKTGIFLGETNDWDEDCKNNLHNRQTRG